MAFNIFDFFRKKPDDEEAAAAQAQPLAHLAAAQDQSAEKSAAGLLDRFLPEDPTKRDAVRMALLMAGAGMMQAGGPSRDPTNLMQVLGKGVGAGALGYQQALNDDADRAKVGQAVKSEQIKLNRIADAQTRAKAWSDKYGAPGVGGYSPQALGELMQMQLLNGDEEGARATQAQLQKLQQSGADKGMIATDKGFISAPGWDAALAATEAAKTAGAESAKQTDDIREYNLYVAQAKAAGIVPKDFTEWAQGMKASGSTKVSVNSSESADGAFFKKSAEKQAETFEKLAADYAPAAQDIANIGELRYSLKDNPGGFLTGLQNTASRYGIKLSDNASNIEYATSLINKMIPAQRPPGSGSMSDGDVAMFRASLPQLINTPQGNTLILNTMEAAAKYRQAQAKIANDALSGKISRQEASDKLMALPDPMAEFREFRKEMGADKPVAGPQIPTINSRDEFNNLPTGSYFIMNGKRMRKN